MPVIGPGGRVIPGSQTRVSKQAALTNPSITSGAGTPGAATVAAGATYTPANIDNNFATLVAQVNAIATALRNAGIMS